MNNVIVHGPMGCGKTRNGEALRQHYGMKRVIDCEVFFDGATRELNHNLILVTDEFSTHADWSYMGRVVSFDVAMKEAGLA